jgi:aspartate aminotransferase-like enzyme
MHIGKQRLSTTGPAPLDPAAPAVETEPGLKPCPAPSPGAAVTAGKAPATLDSDSIVKEFRSRSGAIPAGGQGSMKGRIPGGAHLGTCGVEDPFAVLAGLEADLQANGFPVQLGAGVVAIPPKTVNA